MSGCSKLVIFCGVTYLSRLWCIVEIFTYVHINNGEFDNIEFIPVLRRHQEEEDMKSIRRAFDRFDARETYCFNAGDKELMLAIINAAFGSTDNFNPVVKRILDRWQERMSLAPGTAL